MATKLTNKVTREMLAGAHMTRGKYANRGVLVTLLPGDEIEFRVKGTRQRFSTSLAHCFRLAQIITIEANYKQALNDYAQRKKVGRARKPRRPSLPFSKIYFDATKTS